MKNQISASLTLDVSSLADAIAERLQKPDPAALTEVDNHQASHALAAALAVITGLEDHASGAQLRTLLATAGFVLAKPPATPAEPARDWFTSTD